VKNATFKEKQRLQWQCRRGMLELDYLLERFLHQHYEKQPAAVQAAFRQLLRETDPLLFRWLIAAPEDVPDKYSQLLALIRIH